MKHKRKAMAEDAGKKREHKKCLKLNAEISRKRRQKTLKNQIEDENRNARTKPPPGIFAAPPRCPVQRTAAQRGGGFPSRARRFLVRA